MIWFAAGLAFAFLNAITMLINQRYKVDGRLMSGMRGIGVALLFLPALFFAPVPKNGVFWLLIAAEGLVSTFYNARLYEASARYGANSTSLINVLSIGFGLVLWWIVFPRRFVALAESPATFAGIWLSLALVCGGFFLSAKRIFVRGEFSYMLPAVVVLAAMMIIRKEIMTDAEFMSAMTYYCVCSIFFSGVANLSIYAFLRGGMREATRGVSKRTLFAGAMMAIASAATIFCGNVSVLYSPNPAYVSAVALTTPLWTILLNSASGVETRPKMIPTAVMIAGLVLLIYFADKPLHPVF